MSKNKTSPRLRNDIILFAVIIIIAVSGLLILNFSRAEGKSVIILIDGVETARYSINTNLEKVIETENGSNTLVIKSGKVSVKNADCPDLVCVKHREISKDGETIICLPHKLVIEISKETDDNLDVVI